MPSLDISKIISEQVRNLHKVARKTIVDEVLRIYQNNLKNKVGWSINKGLLKQFGDEDIDKPPMWRANRPTVGAGLSIQQAIDKAAQSPTRTFSGRTIGFKIGYLPQLLADSPRIMYFEFGTLTYQDRAGSARVSSAMGDFKRWINPHITPSRMRMRFINVNWYFKRVSGKGRFGTGYMMPILQKKKSSLGQTPHPGIRPVRMFRGSAMKARMEFLSNMDEVRAKIIQTAKGGGLGE